MEDRKKELLTLNWKNTKLAKFIDIEKILKNQIRKNEKYLIIVNGSEEYINIIIQIVFLLTHYSLVNLSVIKEKLED